MIDRYTDGSIQAYLDKLGQRRPRTGWRQCGRSRRGAGRRPSSPWSPTSPWARRSTPPSRTTWSTCRARAEALRRELADLVTLDARGLRGRGRGHEAAPRHRAAEEGARSRSCRPRCKGAAEVPLAGRPKARCAVARLSLPAAEKGNPQRGVRRRRGRDPGRRGRAERRRSTCEINLAWIDDAGLQPEDAGRASKRCSLRPPRLRDGVLALTYSKI